MTHAYHLERSVRLDGLRKFARDLAVSEEFAIAVYESELHRLREGAVVDRFVGILAEKRTKEVLRTK